MRPSRAAVGVTAATHAGGGPGRISPQPTEASGPRVALLVGRSTGSRSSQRAGLSVDPKHPSQPRRSSPCAPAGSITRSSRSPLRRRSFTRRSTVGTFAHASPTAPDISFGVSRTTRSRRCVSLRGDGRSPGSEHRGVDPSPSAAISPRRTRACGRERARVVSLAVMTSPLDDGAETSAARKERVGLCVGEPLLCLQPRLKRDTLFSRSKTHAEFEGRHLREGGWGHGVVEDRAARA